MECAAQFKATNLWNSIIQEISNIVNTEGLSKRSDGCAQRKCASGASLIAGLRKFLQENTEIQISRTNVTKLCQKLVDQNIIVSVPLSTRPFSDKNNRWYSANVTSPLTTHSLARDRRRSQSASNVNSTPHRETVASQDADREVKSSPALSRLGLDPWKRVSLRRSKVDMKAPIDNCRHLALCRLLKRLDIPMISDLVHIGEEDSKVHITPEQEMRYTEILSPPNRECKDTNPATTFSHAGNLLCDIFSPHSSDDCGSIPRDEYIGLQSDAAFAKVCHAISVKEDPLLWSRLSDVHMSVYNLIVSLKYSAAVECLQLANQLLPQYHRLLAHLLCVFCGVYVSLSSSGIVARRRVLANLVPLCIQNVSGVGMTRRRAICIFEFYVTYHAEIFRKPSLIEADIVPGEQALCNGVISQFCVPIPIAEYDTLTTQATDKAIVGLVESVIGSNRFTPKEKTAKLNALKRYHRHVFRKYYSNL